MVILGVRKKVTISIGEKIFTPLIRNISAVVLWANNMEYKLIKTIRIKDKEITHGLG